MARSVSEIKAGIATNFMANETMAAYYGFNAGDEFESVFSKVSFESLLFYIVAAAIFVVESLFDVLQSETDAALTERLTHGVGWYAAMAKAFQYGYAFNEETGGYNTVDEASQIISHATANEINGIVTIKIAQTVGEGLAAISNEDLTFPGALTMFEAYVKLAKDFGVKVNIITGNGDDLKAVYDIFYDPLVLDENGKLLTDSSKEPAREAISKFIKSLPFNGVFVPVHMTDAIQAASGIRIPVLLNCEARYGANEYEIVDGKTVPYYGYLTIADLTLNYRPYDAD
jgi:hypothetical protein